MTRVQNNWLRSVDTQHQVGHSFGSLMEKIVVHDNWLELMLPVGESPGEGIYNKTAEV